MNDRNWPILKYTMTPAMFFHVQSRGIEKRTSNVLYNARKMCATTVEKFRTQSTLKMASKWPQSQNQNQISYTEIHRF